MTKGFQNSTTRTLLLATAVAAPLALNWGCDAEDAGGPQAEENTPEELEDGAKTDAEETEVPLRDGEERFGKGITPFHEVEVAGTRFRFLRVDNPDIGPSSVALLVSQSSDGIAIAQEPALAEASMLDMFLAITDDDVPLPEELLADEDHELGPRGWFADRAARGDYPVFRSLCNATNFESALVNWLSYINDTTAPWVHDTSPTEANWGMDSVPGCSGCNFSRYSTTAYPIDNADELKAAIQICALGSHPTVGGQADFGPSVWLKYRTQTLSTGNFWHRDIPASETGTTHSLRWLGSQNGDNDWDFKWEISEAVISDGFSMGLVKEGWGW